MVIKKDSELSGDSILETEKKKPTHRNLELLPMLAAVYRVIFKNKRGIRVESI